MAQGVATSTMSVPSLAVMGVGARHPDNKPDMRSPPEQEVHEQFGSGLATTDAKRVVPSLRDLEDQVGRQPQP